jgi:hypothetical protein
MPAQRLTEQCACHSRYTLTLAPSQLLITQNRTARDFTTYDELGPGCDQADRIGWMDSTPDTDVWSGRDCGTEWTITVHVSQG